MFDVRERMLGFVERWNIAPRLHRQSVAEHSYYVTLYASELGRLLGLSNGQMVDLLQYALRHDMAEIVTGDMPGPAKRAVVDKRKLQEYEYDFLQSIGQTEGSQFADEELRKIVKAADTIDAYFWSVMEVARGNQMMGGEAKIAEDRMGMALRALHLNEWVFKIIDQAERMFGPIELAPRLDTDIHGEDPQDDEIPFD